MYCLAHSLNLCLQDVSRISTHIDEALDLVNELAKFVKLLPKCHHLFETIKAQVSPETGNLQPLCPTRWTVRTAAIESIITNYSILFKLLDEIHESSWDEFSVKAGGLLTHLEKFGTYFFVLSYHSWYLVPLNNYHEHYRVKDTTIQEAKSAALLTISHLKRQRTDSTFSRFYDHVLREAHDITNEPVLPRKRKIPKQINDGAQC